MVNIAPTGSIAPRTISVVEYRGNHTAFELQDPRRYWLGRCTAQTPEAAMEWIRTRVRRTGWQLDGPARTVARNWLDDSGSQRAALHRLRCGSPVSFVLSDDRARYEVFVQPLPGISSCPPGAQARPVERTGRRRHATVRRKSALRRLAGLAIPTLIVAAFSLLLPPR